MSAPATDLSGGDITVRDLISSLTALHVLSMVMVDSTDDDDILNLAVSALPSLSRQCRAEAVWLDGAWHSVDSLRGPVGPLAGLEADVANLGPAGESVRLQEARWAWAFPLSSRGGASGYLVVGAPEQPPEHERSLIRALAHQTGVALANARLLTRERATRVRFADERATLRRVATLVARAAAPEEVFAAVAAEAARLLDADFAVMSRYEEHGTATVVGAWGASAEPGPLPLGTRLDLRDPSVHTLVFETDRPARIQDHGGSNAAGATIAEQWEARAVVGVPIHIEGRLWGVIVVASRRGESLPLDTETWLAGFTELVAAAIANAEAQAALTASRARIVASADTARDGIQRDLHDGAQQRLVSLALQLRAAQAEVPPDASGLAAELERTAGGLDAAIDELREIAHGIHPAALAKGGLVPALRGLARRSAVPVRVDDRISARLPEQIELAAYYVVAEALTNAAKHANATGVDVEVVADAGVVRVCVRDDGRGGADVSGGSGLLGIRDRVETLGGRISLHSPPGSGTRLEIALPLPGEELDGRGDGWERSSSRARRSAVETAGDARRRHR
jgi:signal transduction histidine kinase